MSATAIEWAEHVWNPVAGCTRVSPGCDNCYAATMTRRLEAMGQEDYSGLTTPKHFNGKINLLPHKLDVPLHRKKPTRWFVNSMSDLFHKDVPDSFIDQVFAVMALCPQHQFLVLTKRPERMRDYMSRDGLASLIADHVSGRLDPKCQGEGESTCEVIEKDWPLPNAWLGVSVENQEQANWRIPLLWKTPAAIRFLSCEPLLSHVELRKHWYSTHNWHDWLTGKTGLGRTEDASQLHSHKETGKKLDWVIVGGESGPGARPMHPDWARSIRDQCKAANVPFFFKQHGAWAPSEDNPLEPETLPWAPGAYQGMVRVGKKAAGRLLDGIEHNAMP